MKVKTFLNKMMLSSSIDTVRIEKNGYTKKEYDWMDLKCECYGEYGNETVKTFWIHDKVMILNI